MKKWQLAGTTAVTALFFGMGAAHAQVTPEEVWQNWQDMSASYGQTVQSTSATRDGDTLRVEGAAITMDDGAGGLVDAQLGQINFRDLGDGTVEVTMAESYPIKMTVPKTEDGSGPTNLTMLVSQPGMKMIAGGNATETSYAATAPTLNVKIDEIEGVDAAAVDMNVDVTITGLDAKYLVAGSADAKSIDSTFGAASMAMVIKATNPEDASNVDMTVNIADLAGSTKGTFLGVAMMENMAEALNAGFNAEGGFSYGKTTFDMNVTEAKGPTKVTGTAESGNITFALDKTRMAYGLGGKGMAMTVSGPEIPFPEVKVTYSEALFNLLMPVSKSDVPEDFAFTTKLIDFAISEDIWSMFDPTGNLPHDPATVIIDTKGKARLTVDITDTKATAALGDAPPGELHALELTELRASIAGAELTGTGALTFDNTDLTTFQGMPVPTGKIDLKLVGANTLLDKLIAMGLVPEDQAMGFRMMSGMFATVGEGPDTLTSTLEFKDKGFYANGQRLQ
jgi:Uncharacterized protein conserved in bacteria (DUF2125)